MKSSYLSVLSILAGLLTWQLVTVMALVPHFLLPSPLSLVNELWQDPQLYAAHLLYTFLNATAGFLIAVLLSLFTAALFVRYRTVEKIVYPYVLLFKITPTIALTPLLVLWLGIGSGSKIVIVVLICFFPVFIGALKGFKAVDPEALDLFRSLSATPLQTLRHLRLPSALPYLFPAFKVSILLALTGALVGEFIAANRGIGYFALHSLRTYDSPAMFAAITALVLLGSYLFWIFDKAERYFVFWQRHEGM